MSDTATDSGFEFKHRIAGAIILIAIAVFILPLILKQQAGNPEGTKAVAEFRQLQDESEDFISQIRPVSEVPSDATGQSTIQPISGSPLTASTDSTEKRVAPPPADPDSRKNQENTETTVKSTKNWPSSSQTKDSKKKQVTEPVVGADSGVKATRKTAKTGDGSPSSAVAAQTDNEITPTAKNEPVSDQSRGWVVQVGTFSKNDNAANFLGKVRKNGFKADSSKARLNGKDVTRVWVGPFERRVDAAKARRGVQDKLKVKGFITPYP